MSEAYLDNASTTKVLAPVAEAMADVAARAWGNPSSEHERGRIAREVLEQSRAVVADALGVDHEEVFFTSGATEANNLAIRGACQAAARENGAGRIVVGVLEHPSVTRTVRGLKREGWEVAYLDAPHGEVDLAQLEELLSQKTTLVTNMLVQNELGYLLPVGDIAAACRRLSRATIVHSDAAQAFGKVEVLPRKLDVDLLSVASHKIGGPAGVGALYVRRGTKMFTTAFGGGQERGLRSGTEPVFLIAGFARAVELSMDEREKRLRRTEELRDRLLAGLHRIAPDVAVHSRQDGSPYIVNFVLCASSASAVSWCRGRPPARTAGTRCRRARGARSTRRCSSWPGILNRSKPARCG